LLESSETQFLTVFKYTCNNVIRQISPFYTVIIVKKRSSFPTDKQYWVNIGPILGILAKIGQLWQYRANIGEMFAIMANNTECFTDIDSKILRQY